MTQRSKRTQRSAVGSTAWLGRYRRAIKALEKWKAVRFYHGTPVVVDCERYKGPGIAVSDGMCPPDRVAVSLPNGNTWWYDVESVRPNSGMNDSQSHQPSMTSEQLDRFQDWLNREAVEANNKSGAYFNGRACAFNDAFECLAILRMKASQTPESTETDKSQSAS